jgi:hypothetical protein
MPRYYLHVYNDIVALDDEGLERPGLREVLIEAERGARELAADEVRHGTLHLDHRIEVADENGSVVATIMFRDLVRVEG